MRWRCTGTFEYGIEQLFDDFQAVAAFPQMAVPGNNAKEMISFVNDSGFGAYLMLAHKWANFDATRKSYDLIARPMFPVWQGHQESTQQASARARAARPELADIHAKAVEAATQRYQEEAARRAG